MGDRRVITDVRGHHEDHMMTLGFDLEGRLDGVVDSTEARGIMGTPRVGICVEGVFNFKEFAAERGGHGS